MAKGESPLKQFEVQPIVEINVFGLDLSFTNSALWMTITTVFIIAFFTIPFLKTKKTNSVEDLYPSRLQVASELGFNFMNCTSRNGSPQQIPLRQLPFANESKPHSCCRAFWAISGEIIFKD